MSWVAAATVAVGAYGASQQSKAAKKAAQAQAGASDAANEFDWKIFQQQRADQAPWRGAGLVGLNEYMANLGLSPGAATDALAASDPASAYLQANPDVAADDYFGQNPLKHYQQYGQKEGRVWGAAPGTGQSGGGGYSSQTQQQAFDKFRSNPGYQFGFTEGQKGVETSAAARGGLFSGATGKALQRFGNDYADQQGYTPYMNRLGNLAGIGQTATNQVGQYGSQVAQSTGQNLLNAGNARASGINGSANAWGNFAGGLAGMAGQYVGNKGWGWGGV